MRKLIVNLLPSPFSQPERVELSVSAEKLGPGPSDDRFVVIDPVEKKRPYNYPDLPPFGGLRHDHLITAEEMGEIGLRDSRFMAVHIYGVARFVMDVWEKYVGRRIPWWFEETYDRLELVPRADFRNAHCGYGYLETGRADPARAPFALNFDVIAHEIGHLVVFAEVGIPGSGGDEAHYLGLHETVADWSAVIALLHFEFVLDNVLRQTSGNLYTLNHISRTAKLTPHRKQIRVVPNVMRAGDAYGARNVHLLAMPLVGMLYDVFAMVFQSGLARRALISQNLAENAWFLTHVPARRLQVEFDRAYDGNHLAFRSALIEARDVIGSCLGRALPRLSADGLRYVDVVDALGDAEDALVEHAFTGFSHRSRVLSCAAWRNLD